MIRKSESESLRPGPVHEGQHFNSTDNVEKKGGKHFDGKF